MNYISAWKRLPGNLISFQPKWRKEILTLFYPELFNSWCLRSKNIQQKRSDIYEMNFRLFSGILKTWKVC